jgi:hypothetical protein
MADKTPQPHLDERDFFKFLARLFEDYEHGERVRIAERIAWGYHLLYRRVEGETMWKPDELRRFIGACPDGRVAQWFLEESPYIAVERPSVTAASGNMVKAVTDAMHQTIDMWEQLVECSDFQTLTKAERAEMLDEVREAEQAVARVRTLLLDPPTQPPQSPMRDGFSSA